MTNHLDGASTHRSGRDPAGTVCLQFMGGGRMGEALFAGLIASGAEQAETIVVVEPLAVRRDELRTAHPGLVVSDAPVSCLLYTSDAADDLLCVDLGGRRIIQKKTIHSYGS